MNQSIEKTTRFHELNKFVDQHLNVPFQLGQALAEIKEESLYKEDYNTWDQYVASKQHMTTQHANRLIEAWTIKNEPEGSSLRNERQARALAKVPREKRKRVMDALAEGKEAITADRITKAAEGFLASPEAIMQGVDPIVDAQELDELGFPLPAATLERWHRRGVIMELLKQVSSVKSKVKASMEAGEWLGNNINFQSMMADLSNAYSTIKFCMPYAVCTSCNGVRIEKCTLCKGTGLVSEFTWNKICPVEIKELRKKGLNK